MDEMQGVDPIPPSAIPQLAPYSGSRPVTPIKYVATVLLHPFAPPPGNDPRPNVPFYQLCVARIVGFNNVFFSAQISGCEYGNWWYMITPERGVELSVDRGLSWSSVDNGWQLPAADWLPSTASCAGESPLNWMGAQNTSWWKMPVQVANQKAHGADWMWFDTDTMAPVRLMFGVQPPTPTTGRPDALPLFQNFSFSYFSEFQRWDISDQDAIAPAVWEDISIPGFSTGNPNHYPMLEWADNQGITAFMTPVNERFDPMPTRVLFRWDSDPFTQGKIRAQKTLMRYPEPYPPDNWSYQLALLERSPDGDHGGQDAFYGPDGNLKENNSMPFGVQPPYWATKGNGQIHATISNNPVLCPDETIIVVGVLFPKSEPDYPEATYLWTWYAPISGSLGRPVVFMQSSSALGVGTSLALADYFYFSTYDTAIDAGNFQLPESIPVD